MYYGRALIGTMIHVFRIPNEEYQPSNSFNLNKNLLRAVAGHILLYIHGRQ
jgi:hypothetical protein